MELKFVKCEEKYWDFIRKLRNSAVAQKGFREQVNITQDQQVLYMNKYNSCYWVCLADGEPAGYIGVIKDDIRVAVCHWYQGQGVGKFMVDNLMEVAPNAQAVIKINNLASQNLFKACGFKTTYVIMEKNPVADPAEENSSEVVTEYGIVRKFDVRRSIAFCDVLGSTYEFHSACFNSGMQNRLPQKDDRVKISRKGRTVLRASLLD